MKVLQLRNHIPISGPARREPADGTESAMRVSLGFEPDWFHRRCGVNFSKRWHCDPYYRYESLKKMKEELVKAFPDVSYWNRSRTDDLATISGCYGSYCLAHAFGVELHYAANSWPFLSPEKLSIRKIENLDVYTVMNHPVIEELFQQMDIIEQEWGTTHGFISPLHYKMRRSTRSARTWKESIANLRPAMSSWPISKRQPRIAG